MKVQEIMSTHVETVPPTTTLRHAARRMSDLSVGTLPVVEDGRLLGIITDRDISVYAIAMGHDPQSTEVRKVMSQNVVTCHGNDDITSAAQLMEQHNIRRLAVVDGGDTIAGFLSVDDLAHVSRELAGAVLESVTPIH